jgi:hypothetical protein
MVFLLLNDIMKINESLERFLWNNTPKIVDSMVHLTTLASIILSLAELRCDPFIEKIRSVTYLTTFHYCTVKDYLNF